MTAMSYGNIIGLTELMINANPRFLPNSSDQNPILALACTARRCCQRVINAPYYSPYRQANSRDNGSIRDEIR